MTRLSEINDLQFQATGPWLIKKRDCPSTRLKCDVSVLLNFKILLHS